MRVVACCLQFLKVKTILDKLWVPVSKCTLDKKEDTAPRSRPHPAASWRQENDRVAEEPAEEEGSEDT